MPFVVPPAPLEYWRRRGLKPVTDADITLLESRLGGKAPPSYVLFMKTFGNVEFDTDVDSQFTYVFEEAGQQERGTRLVGHIQSLAPHLLPFAMDRSQGQLLIEFGQPTERIFYWNFDTHDWESGTTRLGFVAKDMYDFINSLKPFDG
jgi:hypothetical protein